MSGQVVHFEVPADDLERASVFYREAFGWQVAVVPGLDYALAGTTETDTGGRPVVPGAINGGMLRRQAPVQRPVIVIDVEDIDAALADVERLGGSTVLPRNQVSTMGWSAYFTDSEGNMMGLWQSAPS